MKSENLRRIADDRRATVRDLWKVVGRLGAAVAGLAAILLTNIGRAPESLAPNRGNLGTFLLIGGLSGLSYLYLVRPRLNAYVEAQAPSESRTPRAWQYAVLTSALERHGLTTSFAASVGADVVAYALVAGGSWALTGTLTDRELTFAWIAATLALLWAAFYGLARLMPRRLFADSHSYIRWVELGLIKRFQGAKTEVPLMGVSDRTFNAFVKIAVWRKRATDALFVASIVFLAYLFTSQLPADVFTPIGVEATAFVGAFVVLSLGAWSVFAWVRADRSADMLGQLDYALRIGEITELEATRTFQTIEVLRANHIHPPGGFNQIFEIGAAARPTEPREKGDVTGAERSGADPA